jgi:ketosteroid isomerase-like protein
MMTRVVSAENVELVREALDAFLAGDVERSLEFAHPDIVTFRAPPLPDSQTYLGREGVVQTWEDWTADFEDFEMDVGEFVDAGDRVVVDIVQRGRGRSSGVPVEGRFWLVYTLEEAKIVRFDIFNGRQQALKAAGLTDDND